MKFRSRQLLYMVLVMVLLLDFYLIFNAGNPASIIRFLVPDPAYDVTITVLISLLIVVISFSLRSQTDQGNTIKTLLQNNSAYIAELRKKNQSDEQIAESFMHGLGAKNRVVKWVLRGRVLRHLRKLP